MSIFKHFGQGNHSGRKMQEIKKAIKIARRFCSTTYPSREKGIQYQLFLDGQHVGWVSDLSQATRALAQVHRHLPYRKWTFLAVSEEGETVILGGNEEGATTKEPTYNFQPSEPADCLVSGRGGEGVYIQRGYYWYWDGRTQACLIGHLDSPLKNLSKDELLRYGRQCLQRRYRSKLGW